MMTWQEILADLADAASLIALPVLFVVGLTLVLWLCWWASRR